MLADICKERLTNSQVLSRRRCLASLVMVLTAGPVVLSACAGPAAPPTAAPPASKPAAAQPTPPASAAKPAPTAAAPKVVKPPQKVTVVTTGAGGIIGMGLKLLKDRELDKANGIDVELKQFTQADGEIATLTGKIDIGFFTPISAVKAAAEGTEVRMFAPNCLQYVWWLVPTASKAQSIADTKGTKVASNLPITGTYQTTKLILAEYGFNFEKDWQVVGAAPQAAAGFLEKGDVETGAMPEPVATLLIATGKFRAVAQLNEMWKQKQGVDLLMIGWASLPKWIEANRDAALGFRKAIIQANETVRATKDIAARYPDVWGLKSEKDIELGQARIPGFLPVEWNDKVIKSMVYQTQRAMEFDFAPKMSPDRVERLFLP